MLKIKLFFSVLLRFFASPKTITFLGFLVLIIICVPLVQKIKTKNQVDAEIARLQQEIKDNQGKNVDLKNMIKYLESDHFTEEKARLNFGLKKPGENVAVIQFYEATSTEEIKTANLKSEKGTNFNRWYRYFFD